MTCLEYLAGSPAGNAVVREYQAGNAVVREYQAGSQAGNSVGVESMRLHQHRALEKRYGGQQ
jgi:hypothetical protein